MKMNFKMSLGAVAVGLGFPLMGVVLGITVIAHESLSEEKACECPAQWKELVRVKDPDLPFTCNGPLVEWKGYAKVRKTAKGEYVWEQPGYGELFRILPDGTRVEGDLQAKAERFCRFYHGGVYWPHTSFPIVTVPNNSKEKKE